MNLIDQLASGALGVRLDARDLIENEGSELRAVLADPAHEVVWEAITSPFRTQVDEGTLGGWRRQAERDAREQFVEEYGSHAHDGTFGERGPRTDDAGWSPVVEAGLVDCAGPALQAIHRKAYEPGREWVVGRLLVPLPDGTLEIVAHALAAETGWRESALMLLGPRPEPLAQAVYDDPAHDGTFPHHALSRARRALAWMRGRLARTAGAPAAAGGPREVPQHALSVALPPRFAPMAGPAPRNLGPALFVRVGLTALSITETFDAWRIAGGRGVRDLVGLARLAEDNVRGWTREGVADIEVDVVRGPDRAGCVTADSEVRFVVGGRAHSASMSWFLTEDGDVLRLALTTPPAVPGAERRGELDAACASLRHGPVC
jgi:hypothetical protein